MAEKFVRHLILLGPRRRMKAQGDTELFDLRPERIETAVMNTLAVDGLGAERQAGYF